MVRVDNTWYTAAVTVPPDALPRVSWPRHAVGRAATLLYLRRPVLRCRDPSRDDMYVEIFPLRDLDQHPDLGWLEFFVILTVAAAVMGGRSVRPQWAACFDRSGV